MSTELDGDAANATGTMLLQNLNDEVVVGSYSCEATLLSEEGPVTDWDLHVTVDGWEEFRPGAFPDPVPVAPEGLVRGVDQARGAWEWLRLPGTILPGAGIHIVGDTVICSTGYLAERDGQMFTMTAGECGAPGTQLGIPADERLIPEPVGAVVESVDTGHGPEVALVELDDSVPVSPPLPFPEALLGVKDAAWVEENNPRLCRLGAHTGFSCGDLLEVQDGGLFQFSGVVQFSDLGGPVFAVNDEGMWAVGVVTGGNPGEGILAGVEIAPWLDTWDLTLLGTS